MVESLTRNLLVGDYEAALKLVRDPVNQRALGQFRTLAREGKAPLNHVAALAELDFYIGDNKAAQRLLRKYVGRHGKARRFPPSASARARLQAAEYCYSGNSIPRYKIAANIATLVLEQAERANDVTGVGEAAYYLMRIHRRLHDIEAVNRASRRAIDAFSVMEVPALPAHTPRVRRWRIGSVYLVAGFTHWRKGDLDSAMSLLRTAELLLEATPDVIAKSNVIHTIGALLRSRGNAAEALTYLRRAHDLYLDAGHILNRGRVLTDLGRTHLALGEWREANDAFDAAEELGSSSPRHLAENALWRSWLAQTDSKYRHTRVATESATLAALASSISLKVEGLIALGYVKAQQKEIDKAQECFEGALREAKKPGAGKHRVNALLSLADFYWQYQPLERHIAVKRLDEARDEMSKTGITSAYLTDKARRIATEIENSDPSSMFVRSWDRVTDEGLRVSERAITNWAIRRGLIEAKGDKTQAARLLQVEAEALRQRIRRMRQRTRAGSSRSGRVAAKRR